MFRPALVRRVPTATGKAAAFVAAGRDDMMPQAWVWTGADARGLPGQATVFPGETVG
jgi:hypothetical protein